MKKILSSFILSIFSATIWAGNYDFLVVELSSGKQVSFASAGLTLTYSETAMTVTPASGNASTFTLTDLSKMYFSSASTGIEKIHAVNDGPVKIFSVDGVQAGTFESLEAARKRLAKGTYVVKSQSGNIKISIP